MASSTLNIGQELHGESTVYRIESVLGQGSFGITYKAKAFTVMKGKFGEELVESSRPKAIKEFFMKEVNERDASGSVTGMSEGSLSYNYAQKFKKEAENLASMNHPNIVKVIDFISANNTYYYVMDYIEGENLNDYLKSHKMSEEEATNTIIEVAKALKYMHEEKHMLHLDLKPGNIMRRSSDGHIFLIDFGLSKHYSDNGVPETSTSIGLGTPGYAPIEQANSGKSKQFRATLDVYALGATLYKLLTGETPPSASDVMNDGLPVETLQTKGISANTIAVLEKSMEFRARFRFQTIEDFIAAISQKNIRERETVEEETVVAKEVYNAQIPISEKKKSIIKTLAECKIEKINKKLAEIECKINGLKVVNKGKIRNKIAWVLLFLITLGSISGLVTKSCWGMWAAQNEQFGDTTFMVNGVSFVMKPVEGGTFQMGSNDGSPDEKPVHSVTLNNFFIGQTEVTQELWKAVMGENPSTWWDDNLPVEHVSWEECQTFFKKLNQLTGQKFRLPTEAEWEYAARGGNKSKGYRYAGSNDLDTVAWYQNNSNELTHPVAMKLPNELGLYDMSGNVWEWCQDKYSRYSSSVQVGSSSQQSSSYRVYRGGAHDCTDAFCHATIRGSGEPTYNDYSLGFRLALSHVSESSREEMKNENIQGSSRADNPKSSQGKRKEDGMNMMGDESNELDVDSDVLEEELKRARERLKEIEKEMNDSIPKTVPTFGLG